MADSQRQSKFAINAKYRQSTHNVVEALVCTVHT